MTRLYPDWTYSEPRPGGCPTCACEECQCPPSREVSKRVMESMDRINAGYARKQNKARQEKSA